MGIAALVTALVLHVHAVQARQQLLAHPVWPAQGTITSPFGRDGARWHPGIDIGMLRSLDGARRGSRTRDARSATCAGSRATATSCVVRSRGYQELYAHLAAWRVRIGAARRARRAHRDRRLHGLVHRHAPAFRGAQARDGGEPVRDGAAAVRRRPVLARPRLLVSAVAKRQPVRVLSFVAPASR